MFLKETINDNVAINVAITEGLVLTFKGIEQISDSLCYPVKGDIKVNYNNVEADVVLWDHYPTTGQIILLYYNNHRIKFLHKSSCLMGQI